MEGNSRTLFRDREGRVGLPEGFDERRGKSEYRMGSHEHQCEREEVSQALDRLFRPTGRGRDRTAIRHRC